MYVYIYLLYYILSYAYYILYIILFCKVATPAKRTKVFWTKSNTVWIGCCGAAMPCRDGLERSGHLPLYRANCWHLMIFYDTSNCREAERFPSEPVMCCGRSGSWKVLEVGDQGRDSDQGNRVAARWKSICCARHPRWGWWKHVNLPEANLQSPCWWWQHFCGQQLAWILKPKPYSHLHPTPTRNFMASHFLLHNIAWWCFFPRSYAWPLISMATESRQPFTIEQGPRVQQLVTVQFDSRWPTWAQHDFSTDRSNLIAKSVAFLGLLSSGLWWFDRLLSLADPSPHVRARYFSGKSWEEVPTHDLHQRVPRWSVGRTWTSPFSVRSEDIWRYMKILKTKYNKGIRHQKGDGLATIQWWTYTPTDQRSVASQGVQAQWPMACCTFQHFPVGWIDVSGQRGYASKLFARKNR